MTNHTALPYHMDDKITISVPSGVRNWFEAWNRHTDFALSASEEWGEAITAVSHFKRGRISADELVDELADSIIAAAHVAHIAGALDGLNERIAQKIIKGMRKVAEIEGGNDAA